MATSGRDFAPFDPSWLSPHVAATFSPRLLTIVSLELHALFCHHFKFVCLLIAQKCLKVMKVLLVYFTLFAVGEILLMQEAVGFKNLIETTFSNSK